MSDVPFQPIALRLTRSVVINGLLAALLLCGLVGWWERHTALDRLEAALRVQGEELAHALPEAVWQVSPDLVQPQLEAASKRVGVAYLAVLEPGGSRPIAEVGQQQLRGLSADIDLPLLREGREIGRLAMMLDRAAIQRSVYEAMLKSMLASLALIVVMVGLVLLLLRRHLQQPMQALAAALRRLEAEDLGAHLDLHRPPRRTRDEIDEVAAALSGLQQRVLRHVDELDARVAERTEQLQRALEQLKILAVTDPLTGCHNRLAFSQKFPEAVAHAQRYERPLAVVFFDVDRFKVINDTHGHPIGDRVLADAGQLLRETLRSSSDWVARYGGEEFVLVLPEASLQQAVDAAERLRQMVEQDIRVPLDGGGSLQITASFGVAQWQRGETGEQLLERADAQLYAAKHAGRNRVMPAVAVIA
ncbi:diguanylate cyclase [Roseateles asaccharophilus]|uniref:diguanylate cyclase n=1 Tax=Roseateles asaccharophilus TaxID=582607 RepID=A0ABU2AEM1_9BURK|nr:diguanylate cyclase [Roseateles asaccharophilus]MDR7335655.1 diguanylate cyclase (GGDEF)-like protein [Roseateles asaccharophilus]